MLATFSLLLLAAAPSTLALLRQPEKLLVLQWIVILVFYQMYEHEFVALSLTFQLYLLSFILPFFACARLARRFPPLPIQYDGIRFTPTVLYLVAGIAGVLTIALTLRLLRAEGFEYAAVRLLISADDSDLRPSFGVGYSFPLVCAAWYVARLCGHAIVAKIFAAFALVIAVGSTSKIFLVIFFLFLYPWHRSSRFNLPWALGAGGVLLASFGASHFFIDKFASDVNLGLQWALFDTLKVYALGGVAAFHLVLDQAASVPSGIMWSAFDDLLGLFVRTPESEILPWASYGQWYGNTYSAFAYWLDAFGVASGVIMGTALGLLYGALYSSRESPGMNFFRVFLLFPLLLIFFQDHYLPSAKMHIAFGFAALLVSLSVPVGMRPAPSA